MATHFATPFATKNDRENFAEISSKISLLQLKFDEISTKFWTKFWQLFLWQNVVAKCCGKTLCHKKKFRQNARGCEILPSGKTFCYNILPKENCSNFVKHFAASIQVLTKSGRNSHQRICGKSCGKTFCHKAPNKKSEKFDEI